MAGGCKSCLSSHKDVIDERLKKGESIEKLSEWLKGQGEMISPPSLLRHRKNHINGMELENNKTARFLGDEKATNTHDYEDETGAPFIDTEAALARIISETTNTNIFESVLEARKFTQLLMERIVQNQLVIVHELQQQYSAGKAGYPDSQIRGLKTILDITNALPTYTDKGILRKMDAANTEQYVEKIRQHAIDFGKKNYKKYSTPWSYLKSKKRFVVPYDLITECAAALHPTNIKKRNEWADEMCTYWEEVLKASLFWTWRYESEVVQIVDENWFDDGKPQSTKEYALIVKTITSKFDNPSAAAADLDVIEALVSAVMEEFSPEDYRQENEEVEET